MNMLSTFLRFFIIGEIKGNEYALMGINVMDHQFGKAKVTAKTNGGSNKSVSCNVTVR